MDTLTRRVEQLEKETHRMGVDMATIAERVLSFATKEDVQLIRTHLQKELVDRTRWLAATIIGAAGISLAVAKLLFG